MTIRASPRTALWPRLSPLDHQCARRLRLLFVFSHHLQRGFHPSVIDLRRLPRRELIAADQPGLAVSLEALHPALDSATSDAYLGRLGGVTFIEWPVRRVLGSWLSSLGYLRSSRAVASEYLPNVSGLFEQCVTLPLGQLGQDHARKVFIVVAGRSWAFRDHLSPVRQQQLLDRQPHHSAMVVLQIERQERR